MTKDELKALFSDLESDHIERTISTTNTDKFGQAICAFKTSSTICDGKSETFKFDGFFDVFF